MASLKKETTCLAKNCAGDHFPRREESDIHFKKRENAKFRSGKGKTAPPSSEKKLVSTEPKCTREKEAISHVQKGETRTARSKGKGASSSGKQRVTMVEGDADDIDEKREEKVRS